MSHGYQFTVLPRAAHAAGYFANLRTLEAGLAYEFARSLLHSHLLTAEEFGEPEFLQLQTDLYPVDVDDAEQVQDALDYLEARDLLEHHPAHPDWVAVRDEGEGAMLPEAAQ